MAKSMRSKTKRNLRARKRATWGRDLQMKAIKSTQEEISKLLGHGTEDASLAKFRSILGKPSMAVEDTAASSSSSSAAAKPEPVADPRDGPVDAAGVLLTTRGASRRMDEIEATRRAVDKVDAARGSAPDGSEYLYTNGLAYEVAHLTGGPIRKGGRAKGSERESREEAARAKRAAPGSSVGAKALQAKLGTVEVRRGGRRSKTRVISRMFDWKSLPKSGNED